MGRRGDRQLLCARMGPRVRARREESEAERGLHEPRGDGEGAGLAGKVLMDGMQHSEVFQGL